MSYVDVYRRLGLHAEASSSGFRDVECRLLGAKSWESMSALPPKADMCAALALVCFGPKADISAGRVAVTQSTARRTLQVPRRQCRKRLGAKAEFSPPI